MSTLKLSPPQGSFLRQAQYYARIRVAEVAVDDGARSLPLDAYSTQQSAGMEKLLTAAAQTGAADVLDPADVAHIDLRDRFGPLRLPEDDLSWRTQLLVDALDKLAEQLEGPDPLATVLGRPQQVMTTVCAMQEILTGDRAVALSSPAVLAAVERTSNRFLNAVKALDGVSRELEIRPGSIAALDIERLATELPYLVSKTLLITGRQAPNAGVLLSHPSAHSVRLSVKRLP